MTKAVLVLLVLMVALVGSVAAVAPAHKLLIRPAAPTVPLHLTEAPVTESAIPEVWLVDSTAEQETYSNGLRVEKKWTTRHLPRKRYKVFNQDGLDARKFNWRSNIAGIVFHTTESPVAPFRQDANEQLKDRARGILAEVRRKNAYHYVIDRVGRVWRVVDEQDMAWHAGRSVWADASAVYVELNDSFLGVSFEAQSDNKSEPVATQAQIRASRSLVEMLRSKHQIAAANCITHAQVSVSLWSSRIGYHTDWASDFPFADVGLPNNYQIPTPALWAFGFEYDDVFRAVMNQRLWPGIGLAEQQLDRQATLLGVSAVEVRKSLRLRYREILQTLDSDESETHTALPMPVSPNQPVKAVPALPAGISPVASTATGDAVPAGVTSSPNLN